MPRLPGVRRLFRLARDRRDVGAEVDEELAFHVDMLVHDLIASGRTPDEARREACERFGDVEAVRQRCFDISTHREARVRRIELFATLGHDLKYAARSLRRAPGFTTVVLLTLALGIGATTAMFSVVRGVLLRPLPYPQADRVVRITPGGPGKDHGTLSAIELNDWSRDLTTLSAVGGYRQWETGSVYGDAPEPIYVKTAHVSAGFFPALGTRAALGRTFLPSDTAQGANHVAVVSHGFWQQQLGGDPQVLGRTIRLSDESYTVLGVMPAGFDFPTPEAAVWLPTSLLGEDDVGAGRVARWMDVVARAKPGVTPAQVRADVETLERRLAESYPESNAGWTSADVQEVRDTIVGPVRRGLLVLLGAVGLVLLVVCVNVANLMLVRGTARERELSLRAAIGAGRTRIMRLLLTESLLLAIAGGMLGVLVAWWAVHALVALSGHYLPRAADIRLDGTVLAFAVAVSLLTGALFGLWPALRASASTSSAVGLREDARGSVGSGGANRARALLVSTEVALAVMLVVSAGLMVRSFERLTSADPGFRPENVLLLRFNFPDPPPDAPPSFRTERRERVVDRVAQVPGVVAVGATKFAPLTGHGETVTFTVPGQPPKPGEEPQVTLLPATPGYFKAMGIPLLAGQDIDASSGDSASGPVAVVSRQMAERIWPGQPAVGQTFTFLGITTRVIGVAGDVRNARLDSLGGLDAYVPDRMMPRSAMSLVVRTKGDPAQMANAVRAAIREVNPGQAFAEVVPFTKKLSEAASTQRFFTVLVAIFGALALVLAAVGLYGVVSYTVRQREREMAVRLALGAPPSRVMALMLRQGMMPVVIGLAIGLVAAVASTRVLRSLLYEVSASDPATYVAVLVLLGAVALVASWVPARGAAMVPPARVLRE
ncbi:MAG TPA: ABC transporter permease [Gemmatimonadaceae bacterium]|nr:ABC transporter permease [Gemmatimonadaceae bacterium]